MAKAPESPRTTGPARGTRAPAVAHAPAGLASRRDYDYECRRLTPGEPLRERLLPLLEQFAVDLEPRSAHVLAGEARTAWQHAIPPVTAPRWSVIFRTLRDPGRWAAAGS